MIPINVTKNYLTYQEYSTLHLGAMTEEEFLVSNARATLDFDTLTDYEFIIRGIDGETDLVKSRLKLAIGVLVEHNYSKIKISSLAGELKTFKMGDSTQTRFTPNELGVGKTDKYPQEALDLLRSVSQLRWVRIRSVATR